MSMKFNFESFFLLFSFRSPTTKVQSTNAITFYFSSPHLYQKQSIINGNPPLKITLNSSTTISPLPSMAPILIPKPSTAVPAAIFFSLFLTSLLAASDTVLSPEKLGIRRREKLSHLHFYFHDIVSGRDPTAVSVVPPPSNASRTLFGAVVMTDDPLTERPEIGSKLLGKAQGFYTGASQTEFGFLMVMNFAFVEGKYNGSYLSILGRNTVMSAVREMPVVGGGGLFRFARGYALAKTYAVNFSSGDAVVEYNVYVFHY
ncbi:hypothetical protein IC582_009155 [Cucumis melo]